MYEAEGGQCCLFTMRARSGSMMKERRVRIKIDWEPTDYPNILVLEEDRMICLGYRD